MNFLALLYSLVSIFIFVAPTGPPFVIMAQDVTATSLSLVWSPPKERYRSGLITKYGICYQKSVLRTNCLDVKEVDADQQLHHFDDFLPNTEYMLQIRAATIVGWGPPGAVYITTLSSGELNYKVELWRLNYEVELWRLNYEVELWRLN